MTNPADIQDIARRAAILVADAEAKGVTLRINPEPLLPLAMGNTKHVIETWAARHPPTPLQAAGPMWKMPVIGKREFAENPANMRDGCTVRIPGEDEL